MANLGAHSEVGKLRKVMVHRPELSLQRLTPSNHDDLLFDLQSFGVDGVTRFSAWEALPAQDALPNFGIFTERLEVLRRLASPTR